ncbi:MAG: hypothetical protein ACRDZ4_22955 [Egibacteraceae bacterium]
MTREFFVHSTSTAANNSVPRPAPRRAAWSVEVAGDGHAEVNRAAAVKAAARYRQDRLREADIGCPYDRLCYVSVMAATVSVRLDNDAARALAQLEASGMSRSEAIRMALIRAAAEQRREQALAAEVAALEADEADREEMREVAALMEELRAAW